MHNEASAFGEAGTRRENRKHLRVGNGLARDQDEEKQRSDLPHPELVNS